MNTSKRHGERLFTREYTLLSIMNLVVSIGFSMVSTTMSRYVHGIGMTVAVAGAVTGAFSLASMVIRPASGFICDRYNRKKLLIASTAMMALCIFLYRVSENTQVLLALRILHGIAFGINSTVNMSMIPAFVPQKRVCEAISYFGIAQSLAVAMGPMIGLGLVNIGGFELTFLVASLLTALSVLFACMVDMGAETGAMERTPGRRLPIRFGDIIAKECLIYTFVDIAIASASGLENSMISLYGASVGIANIGWYFTISAATLCISRLIFGSLADKHGTAAVLYPGLALMAIGFVLLWWQSAPWMFAAAAVIKTLGAGMVRPAIQGECVKSVPPERRGAAASTFYIGSDIGQGTAPAIGGKIVDLSGGDYGLAFGLYALPLIVAGIVYKLTSTYRLRKAR